MFFLLSIPPHTHTHNATHDWISTLVVLVLFDYDGHGMTTKSSRYNRETGNESENFPVFSTSGP